MCSLAWGEGREVLPARVGLLRPAPAILLVQLNPRLLLSYPPPGLDALLSSTPPYPPPPPCPGLPPFRLPVPTDWLALGHGLGSLPGSCAELHFAFCGAPEHQFRVGAGCPSDWWQTVAGRQPSPELPGPVGAVVANRLPCHLVGAAAAIRVFSGAGGGDSPCNGTP